MTQENMLRGTSDLAAMCDQIYGLRKDRALYANGAGPMEIDFVSLKDREQIGQLTSIRLAASRLAPSGSITPTISVIDETGNFEVVSPEGVENKIVARLVGLVTLDPDIPTKELVRISGLTEYTVEKKLKGKGWHRARGGKSGNSPWHQDPVEGCPYSPTGKPKAEEKVVVMRRRDGQRQEPGEPGAGQSVNLDEVVPGTVAKR